MLSVKEVNLLVFFWHIFMLSRKYDIFILFLAALCSWCWTVSLPEFKNLPKNLKQKLLIKVAFFSFGQYVLQIIQQDVTRCCSLLVESAGGLGLSLFGFTAKH